MKKQSSRPKLAPGHLEIHVCIPGTICGTIINKKLTCSIRLLMDETWFGLYRQSQWDEVITSLWVEIESGNNVKEVQIYIRCKGMCYYEITYLQ